MRELLKLSTQVGTQVDGAVLDVPATDPPDPGDQDQEEATLGLMASAAEALRHKSFGACTPEELAAVRRIMRRIRLTFEASPVIRLGSLAGLTFEGPRVLAGWTAPAAAGVYAVLYKPTPRPSRSGTP